MSLNWFSGPRTSLLRGPPARVVLLNPSTVKRCAHPCGRALLVGSHSVDEKRRTMTNSLKRLVFISILVTYSNFPVTAQALGGAGTITGTVTDPTGLVIAGATVRLTNPATGFKRTAQS